MIPPGELEHYRQAAEAEAAADLPVPKLDEETVRRMQLISMQAGQAQGLTDLLQWLRTIAATGMPLGSTASAGETALWRAGFEDCLRRIDLAAAWEDPNDG